MLLFQTSREIIFYFQHFIQVCFYFLGKKTGGGPPLATALNLGAIGHKYSKRESWSLSIKRGIINFAEIMCDKDPNGMQRLESGKFQIMARKCSRTFSEVFVAVLQIKQS